MTHVNYREERKDITWAIDDDYLYSVSTTNYYTKLMTIEKYFEKSDSYDEFILPLKEAISKREFLKQLDVILK